MRSERWLKPFIKVGFLVMLLIAASAAVVFYELRTWKLAHNDLSGLLKLPKPVPAQQPQAAAPLSTPVPPALLAQVASKPARPLTPEDAMTAYLVARFAASQGPDIDVCALLNGASASNSRRASVDDLTTGQLTPGQASESPTLESAFFPTAQLLALPSMAALARSFENARTTGDVSSIKGETFRSAIADAAAEATTHRDELSRSAQHAYHLYVISRAVAMIPQLGADAATQDLCNHEQDLVRSTDSESYAQLEGEEAAILRYLANNGLSPQQVRFDPNLVNAMIVQVNASGISAHVPWLGKVGGPTFEVTSPLAAPAVISGATSAP